MDNKYKMVLDNLVDNIFDATMNDQDFKNEILKEYNNDYKQVIKNGGEKIRNLLGELKLEHGHLQHQKTLAFIDKIKKLSEDKFNNLIEKFTPDNKQMALQFYRKVRGSDNSDTLQEDKAFINLMNRFDIEGEINDLNESSIK